MHGLLARVSYALKGFFPSASSLHLGVAVSGGPDSVALLGALSELTSRKKGWRLSVLHVNHALRPEAIQEQQLVENLSQRWQLPCVVKNLSAPRSQSGIEAWARTERYQFFKQMKAQLCLDAVALAHTRDDQAETVLFRLLRGAGHRGLAGIPARRDGWIIRPLLECSRGEVLAYIADRQLPYAIDPSNADLKYARNKLRHVLLPLLEREFSPRIREHLVQTADALRVEETWIEEQALAAYERTQGGEKRLSRVRLLKEPEALRYRILRIWLERNGSAHELSFLHFQRLSQLVDGKISGHVQLPGAFVVSQVRGELLLTEKRTQEEILSYHYVLTTGESLIISETGWEISVSSPETWNSFPTGAYCRDPWRAIFDLEVLSDQLVVRTVQPGDRIQPLGMQGRKKIHDIFIDKKIDVVQRRYWPLVLCGKEIAWIPGCVRGEYGKVTSSTHRVCQLTVNPLPGNKQLW